MRTTALLVLLAGTAGCVGTVVEGPDLAALDAELTVRSDDGQCPVDEATAEETGLLSASAEAIGRIEGLEQRLFEPGEIEAILEDSHYVHVAFPGNATISLPAYEGYEEATFSDLYLVWDTSADAGPILSGGGSWWTPYPMDEIAERARTAAGIACGS